MDSVAEAAFAWVKANVPSEPENVRYRCQEFSEVLAKEFPSLRLAAGFYDGRHHWWCVAPDGTIVDPTAHQFPSLGFAEYEEVAKEDRPLQRCMGCGGDVYRKLHDGTVNRFAPNFCNEACAWNTEDYLNSTLKGDLT